MRAKGEFTVFDQINTAPPDGILGLSEAYGRDPNPAKINLSVGVYKDPEGHTPIFRAVRQAEQRLLAQEQTKAYRPIAGLPEYAAAVQELVFGQGHEVIVTKRAATAHTPGGTAALRMAGDYLKKMHPGASVWLSDPTWPNHVNVFEASGLSVRTYPYFQQTTHGLAFQEMLTALDTIPAGDVVLLHGCCHNPTGMDPTPAQWTEIARCLTRRRILPLVDFAYQGLANGVRQDAQGVAELCPPGGEMIVCNSFSKNFGLYNERVGALTVVASSRSAAQAVISHVKTCIRCSYSNPPAHGGSIVVTILNHPALRQEWEDEVGQMRQRISSMRRLFVDRLVAHGVRGDYSFLTRQCGMFSFSGLSKDQVKALREKHSIYIVESGRINVAGMTEANMDTLCKAIADVVG